MVANVLRFTSSSANIWERLWDGSEGQLPALVVLPLSKTGVVCWSNNTGEALQDTWYHQPRTPPAVIEQANKNGFRRKGQNTDYWERGSRFLYIGLNKSTNSVTAGFQRKLLLTCSIYCPYILNMVFYKNGYLSGNVSAFKLAKPVPAKDREESVYEKYLV